MLKVYLSGDECCAVQAGDAVGLVNADAVSSELYDGDLGARVSHGAADQAAVGDRLTFDSLVFPYRFSLAAAYDTGQRYTHSSQ